MATGGCLRAAMEMNRMHTGGTCVYTGETGISFLVIFQRDGVVFRRYNIMPEFGSLCCLSTQGRGLSGTVYTPNVYCRIQIDVLNPIIFL